MQAEDAYWPRPRLGRRRCKTVFFVVAGLAAGVLVANFQVSDYRHAMVEIKADRASAPIRVSEVSGRQLVAVSLKNSTPAELTLQTRGALIQSWYPPVMALPLGRWPKVEAGRLTGVEPGRRVPLYLLVEGQEDSPALEIINSTDGSLLQVIPLARGGPDHGHH